MRKKVLSLLLALVMLISMIPMSGQFAIAAAAAETTAGSTNGDTINAEGLVLYSQDFSDTSEGYVGSRVGGWNVTAEDGKATVEIAEVEGRGKVLKVTQYAGASTNTRLDYLLPGTSGYSEAQLSFDLYATSGAQLTDLGLRADELTEPRAYIKTKDNVLMDGVSGTSLVAVMEERWYHIDIIATVGEGNARYYDVYIDGVLARQDQADHDSQLIRGITLGISRGAAATVMLDNVTVSEVLADISTYYTEDFTDVDTSAGAVDVSASDTGWAKYTTGTGTVTVQNVGTADSSNNALVLNMTNADEHLWAYYALEEQYSAVELSYDIYMTAGIRISHMGLYYNNYDSCRGYIGVYNTKSFVTKADTPDTAVADCKANTWYTMRYVYRQNPSVPGTYAYDVYAAEKGGVETRICSGTSTSTVGYLAILMSKRGSTGSIYLDNFRLTQIPATIVYDAFENLPVGPVDVLDGWTVSTYARSATATVTDLADNDHGKVLKLYQTGYEKDNTDGDKALRSFYCLSQSYQDLDLTFDIKVAEKAIITGSLGSAASDLSQSWHRGGIRLQDNSFQKHDSSALNVTDTYAYDTWYPVRISYRYDEETSTYSYNAYFNGNPILTNGTPSAQAAVNSAMFEIARNYEGTVYIDNIVVSDPTREAAAAIEGVEYLGIDHTTKSEWIDTYGTTQAILLAKNTTTEPSFTRDLAASDGTVFYRSTHADNEDYYSDVNGAIKLSSYKTGGGYWCFSAQTHGLDLETPADAGQYASLLNAYSMAGYEDTEAGTMYLPQNGYQFSVPEGEPYVFTIYGNNLFGETGQVKFVFLDSAGNTLGEKLMNYSDFDGGAYVSFAVSGPFTLSIVKLNSNSTNPNRYFGMGAFFFDTLTENYTLGLKAAESTSTARTIDLTWTEPEDASGKVLIFRKAEGGTYSQIASVDAGVKAYADTGLTAGVLYTYKLVCTNGTNNYSAFSKETSCNISAYTKTSITLGQTAYTHSDATQELTVTAVLQDINGQVYANLPVTLDVIWAFDEEEVQTVTAQTNENGELTFTVTPEYLGNATVKASFADNDTYSLAKSEATAPLFVGELVWNEAPVIWKLSDAVKPGDTIGVYGYGIAEGATVQMKLRTSGKTPAETITLDVLQYDVKNGSYLMAKFPETASVGVYDLWVTNSYGTSNTMVLNAARPLFISEYEAWAGLTIKISGRAMDASQFGDQQNTLVHLVRNGNRYPQELTKVTPYSMAFTVGDLELGTYEVEVSNDGGITWGTLKSGQTLTIVEDNSANDYLNTGLAWMAGFNYTDQFNVLDYSATANDATDDTEAFEAAIAAAAANEGGGTVYIPNGNYRISTLDIPAHVVLLGESMENTIITYCGDGSKKNMFEGTDADKDVGYLGFARFTVTLDETRTYETGEPLRPDVFFWLGHEWANNYQYDHRIRTASHFFMYEIKVDSTVVPPVGTVDADIPGTSARGMAIVRMGNERFLLQNCEFYGYNPVGTARFNQYETILGNKWILEKGNFYSSANYTYFEDNYLKGRYTELTDEQLIGDTHGLCFSAWTHLENNFVEKVGGRDTGKNGTTIANDGETYLPESLQYGEFGIVTNATATTVTVYPTDGVLDNIETGTSVYNGMYNRNRVCVNITDGRGLGQMREIESIDYATNTITLKEPWDVLPDSTSKFTILLPLECFTLYNNAEADSAKGVYLYGYCDDAVIANHTCTNTLGISVCANQVGSGTKSRIQTAYYIDIRDNSITGVSKRGQVAHIGLVSERSVDGGNFYATSVFATEIRNNTITGVKGLTPTGRPEAPAASGIVLRSARGKANADNADGDIYAVIIDGNTLNTQDVGISYTLSDYGVLLKDNTFNDCTADHAQCVSTSITYDGPGTTTLTTRSYQLDPDAKIAHLTVINSASVDTVYPAAYSLTLNGTIGVDYYLNLPAEVISNLASYNVVFTLPDMGSTTYTVSAASGTLKTVTLNGTNRTLYLFTCPIAAKEMTGTIYVQVVKADGTWKSEVFEYTAQTYAKYILDNAEDYSDELVALVKAMLNYGTAAQEHFGYNTDVLANSILDSADKTVSTFGGISYSDFSNLPTTDASDTVGFVGATLMLESETGLRLYLNVGDGTTVTAALEGTVPAGVTLKEYKAKPGSGYTGYIEIAGIAAKDLDEVFTVKITASDGSTVTVQHSPMKYSYNVQKGNYDTSLQTLLAALYDYNDAANNFFKPTEG